MQAQSPSHQDPLTLQQNPKSWKPDSLNPEEECRGNLQQAGLIVLISCSCAVMYRLDQGAPCVVGSVKGQPEPSDSTKRAWKRSEHRALEGAFGSTITSRTSEPNYPYCAASAAW